MLAPVLLFAAELTLAEVVADLPHDLAALIAYVILGLFVYFVWYGSKPEVLARYRVDHPPAALEAEPLPDALLPDDSRAPALQPAHGPEYAALPLERAG